MNWRKLPDEEKQRYRESYAADKELRAATKLVRRDWVT